MAAVSRLGLYGGSRSPYASFAGKTPGTPAVRARRVIALNGIFDLTTTIDGVFDPDTALAGVFDVTTDLDGETNS